MFFRLKVPLEIAKKFRHKPLLRNVNLESSSASSAQSSAVLFLGSVLLEMPKGIPEQNSDELELVVTDLPDVAVGAHHLCVLQLVAVRREPRFGG